MGKRFACHKISEGAAQAEAIISKDRIMFYQVRPEDGVMTEKDHCLEGQVIAGKVLLFPGGKGKMCIRDRGKAAYDFADFLAAAGQKYWQLLPLGPTSYGDSPYQSFSSFAGNPYFIDLDLLVKDKLLTRAEVNACDWGDDPRYVDYGKIYASRFTLLEKAKARGFTRDREAVAAFERENKRWLPNYALFMALKRHFGMKSWTEWDDEDIRCRTSGEIIERYRTELREDVELFTYIQFLFFRQWERCV